MRKKFLLLAILVSWIGQSLGAADYGLPEKIQQGNILHCFDWTIADVKAELPNIAAAGFGAVQISPLQRSDTKTGSSWHNLYRPYDIAFKGGIGTLDELKALCAEAANYGIKIIVDVVANHVDKTAGYHDTWWDSNGRVRWDGGIDYGNRYSITHGQLGDYGDVNSESAEVQERAKAYIQTLADAGVKGIRWDAAKHIALPSEGCNFWTAVTSVPGLWHYGEILDNPGPDASIIKEYAKYMSFTDNQYCNYAARDNGGIPTGYGGNWAVNYGLGDHVVYWGESHDTYANDEWSQNRDQSVIDRAYCSYACRNNETALYLSRPTTKGFNNIKVGKGSTAFTGKHIAEVNKFRNKMVGKLDYFTNSGNAISVTRKDGGAVIVMKGSGNVSIANGGGYCPAGEYIDKVSGGKFTVTASTITGSVGASGVAVIYEGNVSGGGDNPDPNPDPDPDPDPTSVVIPGDYNLAYTGAYTKVYYWGGASKPEWPGVDMATAVGSDGKTYKVFKVPAGTTNVIFNNGSSQTADLVYSGSYIMNDSGASSVAVTFGAGGGDNPDPDPDPDPAAIAIQGDYNLAYSGAYTKVYYWGGTSKPEWPGLDLASAVGSDGNTYKVFKVAEGTTHVIFNDGSSQTADLVYSGSYIMNDSGATSTKVQFTSEPISVKPVVKATPASGTTFAEEVTITLSVNPEATIYYTVDGSTPSKSSTVYSAPFKLTDTATVKAFGVTADGVEGNVATFSYTKQSGTIVVPSGDNLITDYYSVNPNGNVGTQRTVNMSFSSQKSTTAMSNWSSADLIAQGVARDVCQAFKGLHERPVVDSYAIYASYDEENLYLGVQFVYTVWDLYGEGKQPGESKPYNMDGRMFWAFDLDPNKSFDGYINGNYPIWNADNQPDGAKFDNGIDAIWMGSTKPGVGTPGFFTPTPDGHASYDSAYCKTIPGSYYGYADGLLPSIDHVWGQEFGVTPEALKGNDGFVDLRTEIDDSAHTFYEWKFPLSLLGVTADYIRNNGIGVMYLDVYGVSPVGGTPYDPSYFDNVDDSYSLDPSSSKEKEDEDIITYAPARIGKLASGGGTVGVENIATEEADALTVYSAGGQLYIVTPEATVVKVTNLSGVTTTLDVNAGTNCFGGFARGLYLVNGKKVML